MGSHAVRGFGYSDEFWSDGICTGFVLMGLVTIALIVAICRLQESGDSLADWEPQFKRRFKKTARALPKPQAATKKDA